MVAACAGLTHGDIRAVLAGSDYPDHGRQSGNAPTGFWRVDKDKDPELRHTVLTQIALHSLQQHIATDCGGRDQGIAAFCSQNDGDGWLPPGTLCLSGYGLGHDDRAKVPQPVASRLGPRLYDWQLIQDPSASWRECELHARNLLGEGGCQQLVADIAAGDGDC
jgi:hypothetical protein